jgi:hypothetical protein
MARICKNSPGYGDLRNIEVLIGQREENASHGGRP